MEAKMFTSFCYTHVWFHCICFFCWLDRSKLQNIRTTIIREQMHNDETRPAITLVVFRVGTSKVNRSIAWAGWAEKTMSLFIVVIFSFPCMHWCMWFKLILVVVFSACWLVIQMHAMNWISPIFWLIWDQYIQIDRAETSNADWASSFSAQSAQTPLGTEVI